MQKVLLLTALVVTTGLGLRTTLPCEANHVEPVISWLSWEDAMSMMEEHPKKLFIDVYTEWCGWCKRMDSSTFQDPAVADYINEHFYAVKFDAEMKREILFKKQKFKYVKSGRRGVHTLAYSLLEGKMSYPSFVTLNETFDRIAISPGYKNADQLMKELKYAAEERYKELSWEKYISQGD